ncbi:MAG: dockerin type I repeat-containing protein, partial [Candidatus Zixiibacteriota bacterium]
LTVADLVDLVRYITNTPPPRPFHVRYDFNGDCVINQADAQVFTDYFTYGISAFAPYGGYPIPTCGEATYYSRPGETLWEATIYDYNLRGIDPPTAEGWFDPSTGEFIYEDHWSYFQYDVYLPNNLWFWQEQGTVYWLNITAFVSGGAPVQWGWKSSDDHWNDDAVWSYTGNLFWRDIIEPNGYPYRPGDVDDDGDVDMDDATYLQDYLYGIGPPPPFEINGFYAAADVDADCIVAVSDLVYLINYLVASGSPPQYCPTYQPDAKYNDFSAEFDSTGNLVAGTGTEYYGEGWYYYPWYDWWNIWFYDDPFDTTRMKIITVTVDILPADPTQPAFINLAVNWSTAAWSFDFPGGEAPPLPGENEDLYIGRRTVYEADFTDSMHYEFHVVLPWYNPEWVSIDVIAQNALIRGTVKHACVQSLDLAFVITGDNEGPPPLHEGEVSMHNTDSYLPPMGDPIGTQWHELYPEYCQMWTLTSWFDNNDGKLSFCDYVDFTNNDTQEWRKFHVEWVGPTLTVSVDQTERYVEYICNDYPNIEPITEPVGTYWHEVYPTYCQIWVIVDWVDNGNGYLDFCDYITIRHWFTGEEITVHVEAVDCDLLLNEIKPEPPNPLPDGTNYHNPTGDVPDVGSPIGSQWHELYPEYCQMWTLTSWFDNGSGRLDSCDYVDFTNNETQEWKKFHVEWIGPTIEVERIEYNYDTVYFDMVGRDGVDFFWDTVSNPVGSYWHEVYPVYCQNYYCVRWEDTNQNGIVDAGDFLVFQNLQTGEFERVRVISVEIDIILDEVIPPDPLPEGINLHNEGDYAPPDPEVLNTLWSELHPDFGTEWVITSFVDNGDGYLSPGDSIDFNQDNTKYYVEWIGPTIEVEDPQLELSFWDYTGMANPPWGSDFEVRGSYWHAIYPPQSYCHDLVFVDWADNGSGRLDSCDYIVVQDLVTGEYQTYHVLSLKTDIIISETAGPCDCLPGDANGNGAYNILDVTYLISYLYKGGPAPVPYPLCSGDANCNCTVNILDVTYLITYLYKGGNPPCTCDQWLINCGPPLRSDN